MYFLTRDSVDALTLHTIIFNVVQTFSEDGWKLDAIIQSCPLDSFCQRGSKDGPEGGGLHWDWLCLCCRLLLLFLLLPLFYHICSCQVLGLLILDLILFGTFFLHLEVLLFLLREARLFEHVDSLRALHL